MKNIARILVLVSVIALSGFNSASPDARPSTITRSTEISKGETFEKTIIQLDGSTSREDVIATCNFLAAEKVQLTFNQLSIGKSFLGLLGKSRIQLADGKIELPDGTSEKFKAGGITNFKFIKIQYSQNMQTKAARIDMVEIVD